MSVAFRRESDAEHLEPTVELPIPTNESDIKATKRELRYWNTRQSTAQLLDKPDGTRVAFGCTVDYVLNGKPNTITLVGDDEADSSQGLISFTAPLARAMLDAEVGEAVDFAGKAEALEVRDIRVRPDLFG